MGIVRIIAKIVGYILGFGKVSLRKLKKDKEVVKMKRNKLGYIPKRHSWYVDNNMKRIKVWKDRAKIVHKKGSKNYGVRYCLVTPEFGTLWLKANGVTINPGAQEFLKECWNDNKKYIGLEMRKDKDNEYDKHAIVLIGVRE